MASRVLHIVFMGNPEFSVPALRALNASRHIVRSVVTGSDKRRGRGAVAEPSHVKKSALELGLPVYEADSMKDPALADHLRLLEPDVLVVVAFKMLPVSLLTIPRLGAINLHASLLPAYRGAAPIHHALMRGEPRTGCTVFLLDEGMDTGVILKQEAIDVDLMETTGEVYERLKELGAGLVVQTLDELARGTQQVIPQDDRLASLAPRIHPEDARIDFGLPAMEIHNFVRGMSPFPAAWTTLRGRKVKILKTAPIHPNSVEHGAGLVSGSGAVSESDAPRPELLPAPGQLKWVDGKACVGCADGLLELLEVLPQGKRRVSGREFLNGLSGEAVFDAV